MLSKRAISILGNCARGRGLTQPALYRLAFSAAALLSLVAPARAHAQFLGFGPTIVYDPSAVAKLVTQLSRQAAQLAVARQQLQAQLDNMRKLPNPPWRDIRATMAQLDLVMADARAIAYRVRNMEQVFNTTFPVRNAYVDWPAERRAQAERTVATMRATLKVTAQQAQVFATGMDRLGTMKARVAAIRGHQEALELQSAAGVFAAEELTLLRQALMAQTGMQAVYYADQVDREAQQQETVRARLATLSAPASRRPPVSLRFTP